ncbi:molybdopterin-guanine dinucleotide biosynthesis protein [Arcanobacterium haemolyticum]|uniref:Molybdopterin-guanine dinucleotide biosynthesis protein n=1 Tax=Arcanobacterium haemolyticum (strain ATCC 9345 / DSM 20595 / CCM 5947 / CCUG 17215 / LMG 16163 / NBRC 15585 / NCTC 8452 / 11018) TaxID=644284 RepID=D7BJY4_ARCHD|nr:DUF6457 domain-containing protein [Arcanobacterium haemolyticum]ADH92964.1 putative molybdopterin-guanine dinucleotide biosynthesis protein [Arcanobacterium haemolyticum DSM 20595]QCX47036.1 molybdopterin-guanine dinucleotide biosynthesis protein [Arcanobacterium haemolyticum]SQH28280.1 Uncharacterised protein [Arcanobacterium haemolyticum]
MARKDDPEVMAKMEAWLAVVNEELGLDPALIDATKRPLLKLISTVAHGPSRPGAPLTAFLVGYAAAAQGKNPEELAMKLNKLAEPYLSEE